MATVTREPLSGSTDFNGIKIAATSTPGTTIHTAHATLDDEVYIEAYNSDTQSRVLTLEWGGTTDPDNTIKQTIPAQEGGIIVAAGRMTKNAKVIRGFADSANKIIVYGYINRITD